jgi:endoglucanase
MMKTNKKGVKAGILCLLVCSFTPVYAATPWLHTDANLIKDPCGNTVVLRGVDTIDIGAVQSWYSGGMTALIDRVTNKNDSQGSSPGWYTKVIRLAVYPSDEEDFTSPFTFTPGSDTYYNTLLRPIVDYCKTKDIYAIIDWHYVGNNTFDKVSQTSAFWSYIAPKFANDSHVLFELFNEPGNTGGSDAANWATCKPNMQTWINIIRASAPNNLILVGAPSWSQQVGPAADSPLTGTNLVMVVHLYPGHWTGLYGDPEGYKNQVRRCITRYPIFATEWGFRSSLSGNLQGTIANYGQPLMDFYESYKISNSAWVTDYSWQPQMYDSSWNLLVGPGEMGGFAKDTLYAKRFSDQPGGGDTNAPAAPTGLSAAAGNSMVSLNWNDNNESDLAGYNIYRSITSGSAYSKLNSSIVTTSDYIDYDVDGYVTYYYIVTAVDVYINESNDSSEVSATPTDTIPPSAPTNLTATAGNGMVSLNWNDNTEFDLAGYNIYRSTTSGGGYSKLNGPILSTSDYIDNSVVNGTTYYYIVKAIDTSSNESGPSGEVSATPHIITNISVLGSWASGTTHAKETGSGRALVFVAHAEHTAATSLTAVTYGGQPMTKVIDRVISSSNTYAYAAAFILNEAGVAAAANSTFNLTWNTIPSAPGYASVFLDNVNQTTLVGASDGNTTITLDPIRTNPLPTNNGDMVIVAATCGNSGSYTLGIGYTEGIDQQMGGTATGVTGHKAATGAPETPSADYSSGINRQIIIGLVVKAQAPTYSNCSEVMAAGFRLASDLDSDCYVDYIDLETLASHWVNDGCNQANNYCAQADFVPRDGVVDFLDFGDFAKQWLGCNDPQNPDCTPNW